MEFPKTTVLPRDATKACELFRARLFDFPHVHLVVLGESEELEEVVARAGKAAGAPEELRWVIWARNPQAVRPVLEKLTGPESLKKLVLDGKARLFALSHDDQLRDVIKLEEPATNTRLQLAFYCAEEVVE